MQGPAVVGARVALAAANRAAPGNDPEIIGEHEFAGVFGNPRNERTKQFPERILQHRARVVARCPAPGAGGLTGSPSGYVIAADDRCGG